jgi:hypothetical protein
MKKSPFEHAYKIAKFCKFNINKKIIEKAVRCCTFDNLQKIEKQHGPEYKYKSHTKFFRSGKTGQWKSVFSESDLKFFLSIAGKTLHKLNYTK